MRKGRRSQERHFYWPSRALLGLLFIATTILAVQARRRLLRSATPCTGRMERQLRVSR